MRKIVTIGGGKMRKGGTLAIDKEIVRLSGKRHPRFLFIPTASSDDRGYSRTAQRHFGRLGCTTEVLYLVRERPSRKEIEKKIRAADIIYVGGGNTLMMMRLWRRLGVDRMLKRAWQRGTVMCGLSAGSICWYESGHSDSMSYYNPKRWKYIRVQGLGFLKGIHCPHYDSATLGVKRDKRFQQMIKVRGGMGIAIDDDCAIEYLGDRYRVVSKNKSANAYKVFKKGDRVTVERIKKREAFRPVSELY
jgi:dipeptidase E